MMKFISYLFLSSFLVVLSSCEIAKGIFKAGVWVGVLIVLGVIALIIWLVTRMRK